MKNFLPAKTQWWARAFPFPQLGFGAFFAVTKSPTCIAAQFLYARVISFIIAGQVHKRKPFGKIMGPIMHVPFLIVMPASVSFLADHRQLIGSDFHTTFVAYTTIITTISLLMDAGTALQWLAGKDPGCFQKITKNE